MVIVILNKFQIKFKSFYLGKMDSLEDKSIYN